MTESEWLTCHDPTPMLEWLQRSGKVRDRKLRLFACACCRSMFAVVRVNPWDFDAVVTAERFADGLADLDALAGAAASTTSDWTAAFACADAASIEGGFAAAEHAADNASWEVGSQAASEGGVYDDDHPILVAARAAEKAAQAILLRDIFGDPFRPMPFIDPAWLTDNDPAVLGLAESIYEERAFDRLTELADALDKAGCRQNELLDHLRDPGPHVRGCWAVDLLLGKS